MRENIEKRLRIVLCFFFLAALPVLSATAVEKTGKIGAGPSPDMEIRNEYRPGTGNPVGETVKVENAAVLRHTGESFGYHIIKGLPIYMGDEIMTLGNGRVQLKLNDDSVLTIAPETHLIVNRSVYDPEAGTRSSFFDVGFGKVRCLIQKYIGFSRSEVKIKAVTAVVGVRGSDFVVEVEPRGTTVSTFENTQVEIVRIDDPEQRIMLGDFEQVRIEQDGRISEVRKLIEVELEKIKQDFHFVQPAGEETTRKIDRTFVPPKGTLVDPDDIAGTGAPLTAFEKEKSPAAGFAEPEELFNGLDYVILIHREKQSGPEPFRFPEKP